jgi:hypothetical protein
MKTKLISTITFWLFMLTLNLPAQNNLIGTTEITMGESAGYLSDSPCQAAFSAVPDSLTSFPFYYHFKDLSSGNINAWYWDFGDGAFSTEQNPSHQYAEQGTYKICLSIADLNDTSNCSDQLCQELITLDYFSLGGTVYAGEYPLNSPVNADTGIASLYRIVDNQITFVEDHNFQDYGYYWFGYLFPGEYMVKIGLTQGSPHYKDYFTTYFGDDVSWTKADMLSISTTSLYEAEIHLIPVQQLPSGSGIIRGYVNFEQGQEFSMPPISQTAVILSDINHTPLQFTQPDAAGYFEFTGIPFDTYLLSADATGKPSSIITIALTESSPLVEGINLTVFGSNQNFIPEGYNSGIFLTRIYPNPVRDNLNIKVYSDISAPVEIKVLDVTGRNYYYHTEIFETGINQFFIPAAALPSGVYLLVLQAQGSHRSATAKFIK